MISLISLKDVEKASDDVRVAERVVAGAVSAQAAAESAFRKLHHDYFAQTEEERTKADAPA